MIYRALVQSILTYNAETWMLNVYEHRRKLCVLEMLEILDLSRKR